MSVDDSTLHRLYTVLSAVGHTCAEAMMSPIPDDKMSGGKLLSIAHVCMTML